MSTYHCATTCWPATGGHHIPSKRFDEQLHHWQLKRRRSVPNARVLGERLCGSAQANRSKNITKVRLAKQGARVQVETALHLWQPNAP